MREPLLGDDASEAAHLPQSLVHFAPSQLYVFCHARTSPSLSLSLPHPLQGTRHCESDRMARYGSSDDEEATAEVVRCNDIHELITCLLFPYATLHSHSHCSLNSPVSIPQHMIEMGVGMKMTIQRSTDVCTTHYCSILLNS